MSDTLKQLRDIEQELRAEAQAEADAVRAQAERATYEQERATKKRTLEAQAAIEAYTRALDTVRAHVETNRAAREDLKQAFITGSIPDAIDASDRVYMAFNAAVSAARAALQPLQEPLNQRFIEARAELAARGLAPEQQLSRLDRSRLAVEVFGFDPMASLEFGADVNASINEILLALLEEAEPSARRVLYGVAFGVTGIDYRNIALRHDAEAFSRAAVRLSL